MIAKLLKTRDGEFPRDVSFKNYFCTSVGSCVEMGLEMMSATDFLF